MTILILMEKLTIASKTWLSELETRGCSSNTIDLYKRNITEFNLFLTSELKCNEVDIDSVSRDHIVQALNSYKERKDKRTGETVIRSTQSVMSYYTTLKSFFNWCDQSEKVSKNPIRTIKPPKVAKRVPKALTLKDCQLLLRQANLSSNPERDTLLVKFGLTLGLRLSEISEIKVDDFYPSVKQPKYLKVIGKGDKERVLPLPDSIIKSLKAYLKVRGNTTSNHLFLSSKAPNYLPLTRDGIGQVYDKLLIEANINDKGLRVHMARHSFATHLLNSDSLDLMGVKELLGHSSIATTQIYLKVDPMKLAKSVNKNPLSGL